MRGGGNAPAPPQEGVERHRAPARPVLPAPRDPALVALSGCLPTRLRLGTSSWGYAGWGDAVWGEPATDARLSREGLSAYAAHPLLRTAGVDRAWYAPLAERDAASLAAQVPEDFRFLVKAHEDLTVATFPRHARYGARAGAHNPRFLDPAYACEGVLGPLRAGMGPKLGVLLVPFTPQPVAALGGIGPFSERLHALLAALVRAAEGTCHVAVELRTPGLLVPEVAGAIHAAGAVPGLVAWSGMPSVTVQAARLDADRAPARVLRWMLHAGFVHEAAAARYAPFGRLVDPDPVTRAALAALVRADRDTFVVVNNKAEGSAPASVVALARAVAEAAPAR
ncbi:MAG: hypothetical protein RLZZ299_817 [Pseudomonadota bacterium]